MLENQNIEWKSIWRDDYIKWVSGFANADGGRLEIGKNDAGKVVGVPNANYLLELLPNKIRDILGIVVDVKSHDSNGLMWISIEVDAYPFPVSYKGQYHYRTGSTKQELKGASLNQFLLRKQGRNWDSVPKPHVQISDLSTSAMRTFCEKAVAKQRLGNEILDLSPPELLTKLKLIDGNYVTNAGALLFHPEPGSLYSGANVKIGFFSSPANVLYHDVVEGPVVNQVDQVMDLLLTKYLKAYIRYERVERMEEYLFPVKALREAVINAITHKDYSSGIPIQIKVFENRVIVWNQGELPRGWSTKNLTRLHQSIPFNPSIAEVFFRAGFVESWGRGIDTIVDLSLSYGNEAPKFSNDSGGLEVTFVSDKLGDYLPKKMANSAGDSSVKKVGNGLGKMPGKMPGKTTRLILKKMAADATVTIPELAKYSGLKVRTVEKKIKVLKTEGLIERIGPAKGGYWQVNEV